MQKYGGYLTYSNLQNREENYRNSRMSRDSILVSRQIVVENQILLRVPNEKLDSFVRELNSLIVFLDYRVIKLNDVTLQFLSNQKRTERLQKYEKRQTQHIEKKPSKLNESSNAEDNLLEHQNQADDLQLKTQALEDQIKYCDLTINIYQKTLIVKETIADFDYVSGAAPKFTSRVWDALVQGWGILEETIVFFIKLWGVLLFVVGIIFGVKLLIKLYKKIK